MAKEELAGMLRVYCIDPDSRKVNLSLGISEERSKELSEKAKEIWKNTATISEALEKISMICKNANELSYISFYRGDNVGIVEDVINHLLENPLLKEPLLTALSEMGIHVQESESKTTEEQENSSSELLIDEEQEAPIAYAKSTIKTPNHPGTF
jgi:hypothetical protein